MAPSRFLRPLCTLLVAVAGLASAEAFRPLFHYTPARNWINDPNGLVYFDGEYHLYYQYNPQGDKWGHMSWGHAVSTDLLHWRELPVAIPEDEHYMIFSGSIVVDRLNSSGFGHDGVAPLVAIYTGSTQPDGRLQNQQLAYSTDRGRTWTKYAHNPVLDLGLRHFRDPKVFWYEPQRKWVMVAVLSDRRQVTFFESRDLKQWTHLSDFGPAGFAGGIWECPDLFMLPVAGEHGTKWILKVDMFTGATAGGSGGELFVGEFDGTRYSADAVSSNAQWLDYGADFYAAASWADVPARDGRQLWIGWMNDHHYAQYTPTAPWRGAMSVVRELTLQRRGEGWLVTQMPVRELRTLRGRHTRMAERPIAAGDQSGQGGPVLRRPGTGGQALELNADMVAGSAGEFGVKVAMGTGQETVIGYDVATRELFVDRRRSGEVAFNGEFAARHTAPLVLNSATLSLRILIDASSVEVFANGGERVLTEQIFPARRSTGVSFYAKGGTAVLKVAELWELNSARRP
jgi:fructan beta-fructosidase